MGHNNVAYYVEIIIIIIITRYASTNSFFSVFFVPIKLTHIVHNYLHPNSLLHHFDIKIIIIIIIRLMAFDLMDFRGVGAGVTKNTVKDFFFF